MSHSYIPKSKEIANPASPSKQLKNKGSWEAYEDYSLRNEKLPPYIQIP